MRIFRPAGAPTWLETVLASVERLFRDIMPAPFKLWRSATTDLPPAADYTGALVWDETTSLLSWSNGSAWVSPSLSTHTHTATGDVSGTVSGALTLATVNANVGAFGSTSKTLQITANAKGLITAIAASDIAITAGQVSGLAAVATSGSASDLTAGTLSAARLPAFTGDASSSAGTSALTLATVNSNTGSFGSATQVAQVTLDGKGRVTAAANVTIAPAATSITSPAALSKTDDTNVTLTLGGTPTTSLLRAVSLTLGWTGTLAVSRGGTGTSTSTGTGSVVLSASPALTGTPTAPTASVGDASTQLATTAFADRFYDLRGVDAKSGNYTLVAGDRGKLIMYNAGGAATLTIPSGNVHGVGTKIMVANVTSGAISLTRAAGVTMFYLGGGGSATNADRSLAIGGWAMLIKYGNGFDQWIVFGAGIT